MDEPIEHDGASLESNCACLDDDYVHLEGDNACLDDPRMQLATEFFEPILGILGITLVQTDEGLEARDPIFRTGEEMEACHSLIVQMFGEAHNLKGIYKFLIMVKNKMAKIIKKQPVQFPELYALISANFQLEHVCFKDLLVVNIMTHIISMCIIHKSLKSVGGSYRIDGTDDHYVVYKKDGEVSIFSRNYLQIVHVFSEEIEETEDLQWDERSNMYIAAYTEFLESVEIVEIVDSDVYYHLQHYQCTQIQSGDYFIIHGMDGDCPNSLLDKIFIFTNTGDLLLIVYDVETLTPDYIIGLIENAL